MLPMTAVDCRPSSVPYLKDCQVQASRLDKKRPSGPVRVKAGTDQMDRVERWLWKMLTTRRPPMQDHASLSSRLDSDGQDQWQDRDTEGFRRRAQRAVDGTDSGHELRNVLIDKGIFMRMRTASVTGYTACNAKVTVAHAMESPNRLGTNGRVGSQGPRAVTSGPHRADGARFFLVSSYCMLRRCSAAFRKCRPTLHIGE
jgi:hypothetical protein